MWGQGHGQVEPGDDSFATLALGCRRPYRGHRRLGAWGARSRSGANPARIRQQTEADLKAGRYEQAAAGLARLRDLTPRDYFLKAVVARSCATPTKRSLSSPGSRTTTRPPLRRACWPGRSSCGGTGSNGRRRRCWLRSRWTRHSSRRIGSLSISTEYCCAAASSTSTSKPWRGWPR